MANKQKKQEKQAGGVLPNGMTVEEMARRMAQTGAMPPSTFDPNQLNRSPAEQMQAEAMPQDAQLQGRDLMPNPMQDPGQAQEVVDQNQAQTANTLGVGASGVLGVEDLHRAQVTLEKYKSGKATLDDRIVDNEEWYRQHNQGNATVNIDNSPDSAWLFNSLANKHADAMDNYPEPNVLPRAADDDETAKQLSAILPVALDQNEYEQVYNDCWWYKLKHGVAVKGVFWNPTKQGGLGDIDIRMVDVLNLYWEPGITDIQASRNVFHLEMMDNEAIVERWPWARDHLGLAGVTTTYKYDDTVDTSEKSVVVDWYYRKNGCLHYCKYVNDVVLYASENDPAYAERGYYDHGKYPFVFDVLFPVAGSPAGFGYIELMKGCQYAIDKLGSSVVRNADLGSRVRYFVRGDGAVNEAEFADFTKSFVHVDGNLGEDSLRQINITPLSDIYVTILNNKISELKETSGNRDYSQGATTSGVTAASAIAALQEAGSKLSRDMLKSAYRAFTQECYLCIDLMRQFYTAPRCFRITGDTGKGTEFETFDNKGLRPQPQEPEFGVEFGGRLPVFDVTVVPAKRSTYSRLSQNELAKEMYQMGFFNPQLTDQALACLDMMDFDGKEKIIDKVKQNGTLFDQVQQMQQTMMKMSAIIDAQNGTSVAANMNADIQQTAKNKKGKKATESEKVTTDSIGGVASGNSLAVQAQRRAQNAATPGGQR